MEVVGGIQQAELVGIAQIGVVVGVAPTLAEQHAFADAAKRHDFSAVRGYVEANIEFVNVQPAGRWSALHQFAEKGDAEAVAYLLGKGADKALLTSDGKSALDVAKDDRVRSLLWSSLQAGRSTYGRPAELVAVEAERVVGADDLFNFIGAFTLGLFTPGMQLCTDLQNDQQFAAAPSKINYLLEMAKADLLGHLTFDPPQPASSFRLYNTLGFWICFSEMLVKALILGKGLLWLTFSGTIAYLVAYLLYFSVTCATPPGFPLVALGSMTMYIGVNLWVGAHSLILVLPAVLAFVKAFCTVLMLMSGVKLYKQLAGRHFGGQWMPTNAKEATEMF